jgi:hypothetical protein
MAITRRSLAALLASTALAGCATASTGTTVEVDTIEGYAQDVVNGATALLASPAIATVLSGKDMAAANAALADAEAVLAQIKTSAQTVLLSTGQSWVTQVETDVNTVIGFLGDIPLPSSAGLIIKAIQTLLPILLTSVQIAVNAKAAPGGMTEGQARAILQHPKV